LSDSELFAQEKTADVLQQALLDFDAETYEVPPGIKFTESRAVDPANPPVVIDIANRSLNIKPFDLSDYYTQVRYIKLKDPKPANEGNFSFEINPGIYFESHEMWMMPLLGRPQFKFTDDYIVAGNAHFGIHCYDKQGTFLYTIESNEFPKEYDVAKNMISYAAKDLKGFYGKITANENICLYSIRENNKSLLCLFDLTLGKRITTRPFGQGRALISDNSSTANYVYEMTDTVTRNFLFTFDIKGDTLCRFPNYNPLPELKNTNLSSLPIPDIYYYDKQLTLRQSMNDTVYRMTAPNRLVPAFVLNFGPYRTDVQTYLYGNQSEKLLPNKWKETEWYILFTYTQNRNTQINRRDGSVKFFYSYYDKRNRQFHHIAEASAMPDDQFLIKNPIPDSLPFMLSYIDMEDSQFRVFYSKKRLEEIVNHKEFASLSTDQQNMLKMMQNELEDNEILIMILE
jgi:hypothetical protein